MNDRTDNETRHKCSLPLNSARNILSRLGLSLEDVISSHDFGIEQQEALSAKKLADEGVISSEFVDQIGSTSGIKKWILPFSFAENSAIYMVSAPPNAVIDAHSHSMGFVRSVFSGAMTITDTPRGEIKLEPGDWVYIPAKQRYGYRAGRLGYFGNCCYCLIQSAG